MAIKLTDVSYIYEAGTPFEKCAIDNVNLEISNGDFLGITGVTGSGKSTLIKLFNGLLKPSKGNVEVEGRVGLVFQYPEYQLFEETVIKDVQYGPKNLGLPIEECLKKARTAMNFVGLDSSYEKRSPFSLSGGEKRRVAIAGILAMDPDILVLDEPMAGLDIQSKKLLYKILKNFNKQNKTVVLVSHDMDDVANLCSKVAVVEDGKLQLYKTIKEAFENTKEKTASYALSERLIECGLNIPKSFTEEELIANLRLCKNHPSS